jgi:hypothetical protein
MISGICMSNHLKEMVVRCFNREQQIERLRKP